MGNFDFKGQAPVGEIFNAVTNKPVVEQEMRIKDEENRRNRIKSVMDAVKTGQQIASNMLDIANKRSERKGLNDLSAVIKEPDYKPSTSMAPTPGPVTVQPEVTNAATAGREQRLLDALLRANPNAVTKEMAQLKFPNSAAGPKEQVHYLTLDDGSTVVSRFATNGGGFMDMNGKPLDPAVMARVVNRTYAGDFMVDPVTGAQTFGNKSTGQVQPTKKEENPDLGDLKDPDNALINLRTKSPKVYEKVSAILENVSPAKNPRLEQLVSGAAGASAAKAILLDPKPSQVGLQSLGFHMARASGSNSQLSDAEREQFESPMALIDKVVNKGYKLIAGDLSPKMRVDLLRLNSLLEQKSTKQAERMVAVEKRRARVESGNLWAPGLDSAFPDVKSLIVEAKEIVPQDFEQTGGDDLDKAIAEAKKMLEELKNGKK